MSRYRQAFFFYRQQEGPALPRELGRTRNSAAGQGLKLVGIIFSLLIWLPGCGSHETELATALVRGKVVEQGQPVARALVSFVASSGPMSTGWTVEDGTFELLLPTAKKGAVIGEHKVFVDTGLPTPPAADAPPVPTDREVPPVAASGPTFRYSFTEPIFVKKGQNEFVLDLNQADKHKN